MEPKISLQLWSVKEACEADFLGTLTQVKEMGYDGVEFAGYYGVDAPTLKAHLDQLGLAVSGSHLQLQPLTEQLAETLAFEQIIGNQQVIIPYFDSEEPAAWTALFDSLREMLPAITAAGMTLSYHNHAHELTRFDGRNLLEEMLAAVPGLTLEVDTYWLAFAGLDPLEWMAARPEAIKLLHLKELMDTASGAESTEFGQGRLPLAAYWQFAQRHQLPWVVVEQEAFQAHTPMESAQLNLTTLHHLIQEGSR